MLVHRPRRWPNVKSILGKRSMLIGFRSICMVRTLKSPGGANQSPGGVITQMHDKKITVTK